MRYIFVVNFFILSLSSFAQGPFKVPKEEIGKIKDLYEKASKSIPHGNITKRIIGEVNGF